MRNYWLHRVSHHMEVSHELLDEGILSIGWSYCSSPDFVKRFTDNPHELDKEMRNDRSRHSLFRYLSMKKGDYVIVPLSPKKYFNVYEIADDKSMSVEGFAPLVRDGKIKDCHGNTISINKDGCLCREDNKEEKIDLGFFRKIKEVEVKINRYDYADAELTARMKARQTTLKITDLEASIDNSIDAFKQNKPINIYSDIIARTQEQIFEILQTQLNPDKLEKLIKLYLEKAGANKAVIPPKDEKDKEGDVDIIGVFDRIKTTIYVQAKFHEGTTDDWAITQIEDYVRAKADEDYTTVLWVISTAKKFSDECYKRAQETNGLTLIDGMEFSSMLLEIGITPDFGKI